MGGRDVCSASNQPKSYHIPLVLATKTYKNIGVPKESEKQKKENEKSLKTESKKEVTFLPLFPAVRIYLLDN